VRQSLGAARFELLEGNPYRVILNWTEEQDIDLLVMGTHGLSGIERLILGSVVEKVLHRVDVPLLTVSPEVRGRRPLEEALWRKLMLATDFGPACREVADHALSLARRYQASLLVVHVLPLPEESEGPGSQGVAHDDWARIAAQLRKERERKLEELVPDSELPAGRIERLLLTGFPGPTLARLARERDVDLVVQGGHGHGKHDLGWIGSTAHHLIRAAAAPVLTIRIKKEEGS
jgi:nucleotide-binding universal stress UspA family protein